MIQQLHISFNLLMRELKKIKINWHSFLLYFLLVAFFAISYLIFRFIPDYLIQVGKNRNYPVVQTGTTGDTFGGTLGPIVGWLAALLTFAAFWVQYRANQQQRKQIEDQAKDTAIERFESRFFEMIRLHKENVNELNIEDTVRGRKAFTSFFYEFRYIYFTFAKNYYELEDYLPNRDTEEFELTNIAYIVFFFGVGYNSSKVTDELFERYNDMLFFKNTIGDLKKIRLEYKSYINDKKDLVIKFKDDKATFRIKYQPFNGHTGKLGHYFRHLFQTVKLVDKQDSKIIGRKYDYVKTLRAQLSNFEQLLLYYNCLSVLGTDWIEEEYFFRYEMGRNIPLPYANFGVIPEVFFKPDIDRKDMSFEWTEVKNKINNFESTIASLKKASAKKKADM